MDNKPSQSKMEVLYYISASNAEKIYVSKEEYDELYEMLTDSKNMINIGGAYVSYPGTDHESVTPMRNVIFIGKEAHRLPAGTLK